jgi:hypothetical protein
MTATRECVGVSASIFLAFLDKAFLDERVEVRVEPAVMDLLLVMFGHTSASRPLN